jgi:hypothetical protein
MARGRDEADWNRTRALAEIVWAQWSKKQLPRGVCEPYYEKPSLSKTESKLNWDILMAGLEAMYKRG